LNNLQFPIRKILHLSRHLLLIQQKAHLLQRFPHLYQLQKAETNQTNYSPTNSGDEIDLNRVWEQVLDRVRPHSTQSLLRQHGQLVIFSNDTAYVKIKSQKLLDMVKGKVANIEEAFLQVFNRRVTVKVGLTNPAETNISRAKDLPTSNGRVGENPRNSNPADNAGQQVQTRRVLRLQMIFWGMVEKNKNTRQRLKIPPLMCQPNFRIAIADQRFYRLSE
jgi:hypothetical protein